MAERGVSRAEFIRRRRGSDFVGRRDEVGVFQANLERVAALTALSFCSTSTGSRGLVRPRWSGSGTPRHVIATAR